LATYSQSIGQQLQLEYDHISYSCMCFTSSISKKRMENKSHSSSSLTHGLGFRVQALNPEP
jgi:hypothetical protein